MTRRLTDAAHRLEAEIARFDPKTATADRPAEILSFPISDRYEIDSMTDEQFSLRNRDAVFVRRIPHFGTNIFVTLRGEVQFPGVYALKNRSERLTNLLARSGGLKPDAYAEGIQIERSTVGRVRGVDVPRALQKPGTEVDLVLRNGDVITVPTTPATVKVSGEVFRPGNLLFRQGQGIEYYFDRVGGMNRQADAARTYVIRANGGVAKAKRLLWFWILWPEVDAGSEIVVPGM